MTLLGELYAGGLGVPQNDVKAADWYKLAAGRGDREGMFALAMFRLQGRAGPRDRDAGAKWLAAAAKLGHPLAAYDLALLYMEGQLFPQDFTHAAELLHAAAQAGNAEAQYALGTLYKQGRGVPKDMKEATRLWGLAAIADNADAQVEYGIALFNGDGVPKNEQAAAVIFHQAALHGNAVAQDRLARILAEGRGAPKNSVEATKWHLISKARGETNLTLDDFVNKLDPATRTAGEKAAPPFIDGLKEPKGCGKSDLLWQPAEKAAAAFCDSFRPYNSSSNAFATFRSRVSNPSLNHLYTGARRSRACFGLPCERQSRARLVAARSSQDLAFCRRATVRL